MQSLNKLTIILTTNNKREDFIFRFLNYYDSIYKKKKIKIIISDSGDKKNFIKLKEKIKKKKFNFNLIFKNYIPKNKRYILRDAWGVPEFEYRERLHQVLREVRTKYIVLAADDDFYFPTYFKKAIKFLESNKSFSCVYGHQMKFLLKKFSAHGKIINFKLSKENNPPNPWQEDKKFSDRIQNLGKNPWSWFSWYAIQKTVVLKESIKKARKYNLDGYLFEKFCSFCHSVMFRSKKIKFIYCARQENPIYNDYIGREPFSYFRNIKSLNKFKMACAEFIRDKQKISYKESKNIVDQITEKDFESYKMNDIKEIPRFFKKKYFKYLKNFNLLKKVKPINQYDKRLAMINKYNMKKEKFLLRKFVEIEF